MNHNHEAEWIGRVKSSVNVRKQEERPQERSRSRQLQANSIFSSEQNKKCYCLTTTSRLPPTFKPSLDPLVITHVTYLNATQALSVI